MWSKNGAISRRKVFQLILLPYRTHLLTSSLRLRPHSQFPCAFGSLAAERRASEGHSSTQAAALDRGRRFRGLWTWSLELDSPSYRFNLRGIYPFLNWTIPPSLLCIGDLHLEMGIFHDIPLHGHILIPNITPILSVYIYIYTYKSIRYLPSMSPNDNPI